MGILKKSLPVEHIASALPVVSNLAYPNLSGRESFPPNLRRLWRAPGPCGASPTQPYKCSQNVKVNFFISASAKIKTALTLTWTLTLTLNILTAFIRLGRARPDRGGVPSLLLFFDFSPLHIIFYVYGRVASRRVSVFSDRLLKAPREPYI